MPAPAVPSPRAVVAALLLLLAACAALPTRAGRRVDRTRVPELLLAADAPRFLVSGHRGEYFDDPLDEGGNTMHAFRRAHEAGADLLEVDVETTADGVAVVAHDAWPRARTWEAWRDAGRSPLRLAELLDWARDRTVLVLDVKSPAVGDVVRAVREGDGVERVVFFADDESEHDALRAEGADLYLMVRAHGAAEARAWAARTDPRIVLVHGDPDWLTAAVIADVHASGRRVFANSYREAWHGELLGAEATAASLFRQGIDVAQTNDPAGAARARDRQGGAPPVVR